jgi:hypothetical protein
LIIFRFQIRQFIHELRVEAKNGHPLCVKKNPNLAEERIADAFAEDLFSESSGGTPPPIIGVTTTSLNASHGSNLHDIPTPLSIRSSRGDLRHGHCGVSNDCNYNQCSPCISLKGSEVTSTTGTASVRNGGGGRQKKFIVAVPVRDSAVCLFFAATINKFSPILAQHPSGFLVQAKVRPENSRAFDPVGLCFSMIMVVEKISWYDGKPGRCWSDLPFLGCGPCWTL